MLTIESIDHVAVRIESAYRRHHTGVIPPDLEPKTWSRAARLLLGTRHSDVDLPIDPELFVAAVAPATAGSDAWRKLTQPRSLAAYRRCLRSMVARLRRELASEVALAETRLARGGSAEALLTRPSRRVSPLARYIVAHRIGRPELAHALRREASLQHDACPLYRLASAPLLPWGGYPVAEPIEMLASAAITPITHFSPASN